MLIYDPPGLLDFGQTYHWRIDEINDVDPSSPWQGGVKSFTVIDHFVVDSFEAIDAMTIGIGDEIPGGVGTMFFDDIRLYLRPVVEPESIAIDNASFELPGTEKQKGFDGVAGWSTDGPCADSGVETGYTPTDGEWTAYLMSGDPTVWQLTDHTIAEGQTLELKVDARITWAATSMQMTIYYDDNGVRVPVATSDVVLSDAMQEYVLSFSAGDVPESAGKKVGIEFSNSSSGDTWIGLDNVRLEASSQ